MRVERKLDWSGPATALGVMAAFGLALCAPMIRGQPLTGVEATARDYRVVLEHHLPPFEPQPKWLLAGDMAELRPGGLVLLTGARLTASSTNGTPEVLAQTPECVYDATRQTIHSASRLRIETLDGVFSIEGQGFLLEQTNLTLHISNRVHTVIRRVPGSRLFKR